MFQSQLRELTPSNLELAMCITLSAATEKPTLDRKGVLDLTGYYDWFARIPEVIRQVNANKEAELIFDADYCTRARLYVNPIRSLAERNAFPNSNYFLWVTHMNHGTHKTKVPLIFADIQNRLIAEKFPVEYQKD